MSDEKRSLTDMMIISSAFVIFISLLTVMELIRDLSIIFERLKEAGSQ